MDSVIKCHTPKLFNRSPLFQVGGNYQEKKKKFTSLGKFRLRLSQPDQWAVFRLLRTSPR